MVEESMEQNELETEMQHTFELEFDGSILKIYSVIEENNDTLKKLIMTQPHRTNPDGTIQKWIDEADAFDWFENKRKEIF